MAKHKAAFTEDDGGRILEQVQKFLAENEGKDYPLYGRRNNPVLEVIVSNGVFRLETGNDFNQLVSACYRVCRGANVHKKLLEGLASTAKKLQDAHLEGRFNTRVKSAVNAVEKEAPWKHQGGTKLQPKTAYRKTLLTVTVVSDGASSRYRDLNESIDSRGPMWHYIKLPKKFKVTSCFILTNAELRKAIDKLVKELGADEVNTADLLTLLRKHGQLGDLLSECEAYARQSTDERRVAHLVVEDADVDSSCFYYEHEESKLWR